MRHEEYGLLWELEEGLGQLGLLRENHYRALFTSNPHYTSLCPQDKWLDIGANIGAFALRAAPLVSEVIAVEPEPNNIKCLERNIELNKLDNVYVLKAAIVAGPPRWVDLALSNSFSSTHRLGRIRGRKSIEVAGININDTVRVYSINKIKCDCEGTEAEILEVIDYTPIEEIIFEYHFSFLKDDSWERYFAILDGLVAAGFTILRGPRERSKTWHAIVWAKRL